MKNLHSIRYYEKRLAKLERVFERGLKNEH